MYGNKFTSQFGSTPSDTWIRCLDGITPDQMANGLERCLTEYTQWSPAAVEFRALCLDEEQDWQHKGLAYKKFEDQEALPHLALPRDEQRDRISDLRKRLKL